jgi:hypothetical protein
VFDSFKTYLLGLPNAIALLGELTSSNLTFVQFIDVSSIIFIKFQLGKLGLSIKIYFLESERHLRVQDPRLVVHAVEFCAIDG